MTGVPIRREETQTLTGGTPHEDGDRDWRDASQSQGPTRIASDHQKLEEARKDPNLPL